MTIHSSIHAWKIPWTGGAWRATVHGVTKELDTTEQPSTQDSSKQIISAWPVVSLQVTPAIIPLGHHRHAQAPTLTRWSSSPASPAADLLALQSSSPHRACHAGEGLLYHWQRLLSNSTLKQKVLPTHSF